MMTVSLAVKLLFTPMLVVVASLSARRWGPAVAGWLAGFPLTSAPLALVVTIEQGPAFAAGAAKGSTLGVVSQAVVAAVYISAARRARPWITCAVIGSLAFAVTTAALSRTALPPLTAGGVSAALVTIALIVIPRSKRDVSRVPAPRFDLLLRALVATALVFGVSALATRLGPALTGLVIQFPLYGIVLTVFAHVQEGPSSAAAVMRGLLTGLYGFAAFFVVIAVLVDRAGPAVAFPAATAVLIAVQLVALRFIAPRAPFGSVGRHRPRP